MMLTLRKRDLVTALIGGESRDFPDEESTGWVVTGIDVQAIEEPVAEG